MRKPFFSNCFIKKLTICLIIINVISIQKVNADVNTHSNDKYGIKFKILDSWKLNEFANQEAATDGTIEHQIRIIGETGELITISIFPKANDLKDWIRLFRNSAFSKGLINFEANRVRNFSNEIYSWLTYENSSLVGFSVVYQNQRNLFEINLAITPLTNLNDIKKFLEQLIPLFDVNLLPFDIFKTSFNWPITLGRNCTPCNETDSYDNSYDCCPNSGNCTWYSEKATTGNNNFYFGGPGTGRDGYTWLTKAYQYNTGTNSFGGNIPMVGAIVVFCSNLSGSGGYGHVAYVTGINSNGSITVMEQNCGTTCTRTNTYSTTTLLNSLGGYIYSTTTPPSPTQKNVTGTSIGQETIIDDWNGNNVYNFRTLGPGHYNTYNSNERAWVLLVLGHIIIGITGLRLKLVHLKILDFGL